MYNVGMFGIGPRTLRELDLSFYAPSFRLKQLAWGGYGFGHTSRRSLGSLRGTVVGRKGRFRGFGTTTGR
jgi:hypothetical protein